MDQFGPHLSCNNNNNDKKKHIYVVPELLTASLIFFRLLLESPLNQQQTIAVLLKANGEQGI